MNLLERMLDMKKVKMISSVAVTVVMILMSLGGITAWADESNPVIINPGFEAGESFPSGWWISQGAADYVLEGGVGGGRYISVAPSGIVASGEHITGLTPGGNYKLMLFVKTTKNASAYLEVNFFTEGPAYKSTINTTLLPSSNTGGQWKQVKYNFTLPGDVSIITFHLRSLYDGETVCYDNLELTASTDNNLILNGDFFDEVSSVRPSEWYTTYSGDTWGTAVSLVSGIPGANGNCLKVEGDYKLAYQPVTLKQNQGYKLTYRAMAEGGATPRAQSGDADPSKQVMLFEDTPPAGVWYNYTVYFTTITTHASYGTPFYFRNIGPGNSKAYFDDIVLIEVDDTITYHAAEVGWNAGDGVSYMPFNYSKSAELKNVQGGTIYAHFRLNTKIAEGEVFEGFACVYENEGGVKKLYSVTPVSAAATINNPGTATASIYVPAANGNKTYSLESLMWKDISTIEPYIGKAMLK